MPPKGSRGGRGGSRQSRQPKPRQPTLPFIHLAPPVPAPAEVPPTDTENKIQQRRGSVLEEIIVRPKSEPVLVASTNTSSLGAVREAADLAESSEGQGSGAAPGKVIDSTTKGKAKATGKGRPRVSATTIPTTGEQNITNTATNSAVSAVATLPSVTPITTASATTTATTGAGRGKRTASIDDSAIARARARVPVSNIVDTERSAESSIQDGIAVQKSPVLTAPPAKAPRAKLKPAKVEAVRAEKGKPPPKKPAPRITLKVSAPVVSTADATSSKDSKVTTASTHSRPATGSIRSITPVRTVKVAKSTPEVEKPGKGVKRKMPPQPYQSKVKIQQKYHIIGFISSGTYGRVFKARSRDPENKGEFAIKKFKPDKEGEVSYTGISQSAIREMALCSELGHENVIHLVEIILEDKCIYMVFEYAEHDLLQIIHYHTHPERGRIPEATIKSVLWQLLNGVSYLHQNWVLHRDLKPANIMVTAAGEVKIGDLGLARLFWKPLQPLFSGDKVVVTIWYRAPELLLGSRHYTPAIDLWAVGCIFAELLALRPIFKGEEAKMDNKKNVPFQKNQMGKIIEILGTPTKERWPTIHQQPEYTQLQSFKPTPPQLDVWYTQIGGTNSLGFQLLQGLLEYDPVKRLTAHQALEHKYFQEGAKLSLNAFESAPGVTAIEYPHRRVSQEDNDISQPGTKRTGLQDDSLGGQRKRLKADDR